MMIFFFNEREGSVSVLFPCAFNNLGSIAMLLHNFHWENWAHWDICTFSLLHIWTCYIENWKMQVHSQIMQKNESRKHQAHLSFLVKKLHRRLLLQEKQMNERVSGVLITYHRSRLKCQWFCSASEQLKCLSGFWLGEGRFLKKCELHAHDTFSEANHTLSNQ